MKAAMRKLEEFMEIGGARKDIAFLVLGGISLLLSLAHVNIGPFDAAWIAVIFCGIPIIIEALIGVITEFDIRADVLVSLALIASLIIGQYFAAGEVAFIMQIGAFLEDATVARARAGIEKLVNLTPQVARVIVGNDKCEAVIPAEKVVIGDLIRVLPGETVPVDGVIVSGQTSINQAVMTGESLPVDKSEGDEVSSGTVNQFGAFDMEATKVGEDSSIQRMIRLVQSADAGKAKIVGLADRWATWIVVIALSAAAITWFFSGEILRAVTILVVFCPCALVLATPTAIMAAIGNCTKHGFLVREGDALERLAKVGRVAFDKTGTLTYGVPEVIAVETNGYTENDMLKYAASAEKLSEHPLGKAVVRHYGDDVFQNVDDFTMTPGKGITAVVDGHQVLAGNTVLLDAHHVEIPEQISASAKSYLSQGTTVIYVAVDDSLAGMIVLADTLREESESMIRRILKIGIKPVLLTGDEENAARTIAGKLGITEMKASCLPEDKMAYIEDSQQQGVPICMIGDGINDAPALKKADVGVAMGGVGSDIAVDAADIALIDDAVEELPHLLALARRMMVTIKLNLTFSMTLNFVAIILAILGILNPVVGALVHNAGSVLVIINSSLLLRWRTK